MYTSNLFFLELSVYNRSNIIGIIKRQFFKNIDYVCVYPIILKTSAQFSISKVTE